MSVRDQTFEHLRRLPVARRWVLAARLKTVGLSLTPVLCGTWIASHGHGVNVALAVCAALSALAIQVGTNLWNDAADAERGTDTDERLGPPRMTALGLLDASQVKSAAHLAFATAIIAGLPLVSAGGWPIVAIGLASLLLGYVYSMGPLPLSHTPLGELIVVIFFGVIAVTGTAYVMGADLTKQGIVAGLMMGLPSGGVLLLNNHRDRRTDEAAGRMTLAILADVPGAKIIYGAMLFGSVALLPVLAVRDTLLPAVISLLGLMAAALSYGVWRTPVSAEINRFLPLTVLLQFALFVALVISGG
ncbi:1,4-dihydroxy-2-naphthoate octaprenyltransferase [Aestuariivirga sp.]|uniref:1,4-dihydroxy-2-naphthoate octaprenyltransferase n=1 Tax=Aestuariivirga sp. TaxID=2650926 RepID=UPI0039E6618E